MGGNPVKPMREWSVFRSSEGAKSEFHSPKYMTRNKCLQTVAFLNIIENREEEVAWAAGRMTASRGRQSPCGVSCYE